MNNRETTIQYQAISVGDHTDSTRLRWVRLEFPRGAISVNSVRVQGKLDDISSNFLGHWYDPPLLVADILSTQKYGDIVYVVYRTRSDTTQHPKEWEDLLLYSYDRRIDSIQHLDLWSSIVQQVPGLIPTHVIHIHDYQGNARILCVVRDYNNQHGLVAMNTNTGVSMMTMDYQGVWVVGLSFYCKSHTKCFLTFFCCCVDTPRRIL